MGLDMYLKGKMYVSPYTDDKLYTELNQLTKEMGVSFPANLIEFDVGYWRKANHIHKWFVKNVQENIDDCKEYYVSLDTLKELLETCQTVLNDHSQAEELCPLRDWSQDFGLQYSTSLLLRNSWQAPIG